MDSDFLRYSRSVPTAVLPGLKLHFRKLYGTAPSLFLAIFILSYQCRAQDQDTVKISKTTSDTTLVTKHSPKRAAVYALVLPGLGQAYNHKYWKIPIVYAGFGTMVYFIKFNRDNFRQFRDAYSFVLDGSTGDPPNNLVYRYAQSQLKEGREYYLRNLEVSYIATGAWYILQALDAVVDAHFFDYDVTEDLSLHLSPWTPPAVAGIKPAGGFSLTMRF